MGIRVGIMGFGRIGRNLFRQSMHREDIEIAAICDVGSAESMAYLLDYDTVYGRLGSEVRLDGRDLVAGTQRSRLVRAKSPADMPWDALGVDIVVEATGAYRHRHELEEHLLSGASKVILSTPALDEIDRTVVHGVNDGNLRPTDRIISCGSTTTHVLAIVLKVLDDAVGVARAFGTSVHAYTSDQRLADTITPDLRRSRSAAENLIPNTTFVPEVIGRLFPHLAGHVDMIAVNVPVPNGSNLDLAVQVREPALAAGDVNAIFEKASRGPLAPYVGYATDPIVSTDVIGDDHTTIVDSLATMALPGGLIKMIAWYDNGWGYAARILETITAVGGEA